MRIRLKNIFWYILMVVFVAVVCSACQKGQSDPEDMETWIVKNYFLPDDNPATIEKSFKLCETTNEIAIDNLALIYKSKDLDKTVDELVSAGIEGNCSNCNDDPRYNSIMYSLEKWRAEIEAGRMTPTKLAYEYAFFQHWLYLKFTERITDENIQALYKDAKSKKPKPCLTSRMPKGAKPIQRPGNQETTPNPRPSITKEKSKGSGNSSEDSNSQWFFYASVLLVFLVEWRRGFIDVRQVGKYIIKQFKNADAHSYHTPDTNDGSQKTAQSVVKPMNSNIPEKLTGETNTKPTWAQATQNPPENSSSKESPKTVHEKLQQQLREETSPKTTTPHQIVPSEQPKEAKPETPPPAPSPEPKKEVIPEKQIHIPTPPEPKKQEPVPSVVTYGSSVLFARIPSGNLFFGFSPQPEYPDTPFVIDERTGSFDLVKDPQTLERLFSMIDQLKDACELMNINQPSLTTYHVKVKGVAVKEGDYWRIDKKLKLDW